MMMIQIFSNARRWLASKPAAFRPYDDPLAHPQIAAMTARELGDLPFPRTPEIRPAHVRRNAVPPLARCA